jgi:hypothetical protein
MCLYITIAPKCHLTKTSRYEIISIRKAEMSPSRYEMSPRITHANAIFRDIISIRKLICLLPIVSHLYAPTARLCADFETKPPKF